jgi:hypothetical protein
MDTNGKLSEAGSAITLTTNTGILSDNYPTIDANGQAVAELACDFCTVGSAVISATAQNGVTVSTNVRVIPSE